MNFALSTQQISKIKEVITKLDNLSAELDDALSGCEDERVYTADEVAEILQYELEHIKYEYEGYGDVEIDIEIPIEIKPEGGYSETCYVNVTANKDASEVLGEIAADFKFNFASGEAFECVNAYDARRAEKLAKDQRWAAEQAQKEVEQVNDTEG